MQIGPRIRVGGTLGKIGQKAKIGVGKLAQPVGKVVSVFNPALGTAISTAGDILDTSDGKFNFGKAAKSAAIQYVGGKIVGKVAPKIGGLFKGGGAPEAALDEFGMPSGNLSAGDPSRFRSILSKTGDFLGGKDGFGMDDVLKYGKAAGDAYGAYQGAQDRDRYRQIAEQNYAANAPLRDAGRSMLLDNSTPDLSGLFADPQNPQGRYRRVAVGSRV